MAATSCRSCGREFSGGEQFCPNDGSLLSTPTAPGERAHPDALIGSTLDARYRILRVIGEGGMGVVYAAEHVLIEKQVAIKVLRDTFTGRPDVVERFRQEAKSASKIGHPNIVDVSDFGETPSGQSYIVMEMLTGEDLADVLGRERMLSPARAVRIVYQVARALHATHKKNIVHRDLKPENIYLIERDGAGDIVKVVDFGVAKMNDIEAPASRRLTRTGMIFGTPEYMSPEQAHGKPFDHRVDIYALGAIFFELLTGRVPFEGENFMEILAKHGSSRVPSLLEANPETRVSAELEQIVMRALRKDPNERYQTMGDLAGDLRAVPEMPSVEPGDALEPPVWALTESISSAPPPLPARDGKYETMRISDVELLPADASFPPYEMATAAADLDPSPTASGTDVPPPASAPPPSAANGSEQSLLAVVMAEDARALAETDKPPERQDEVEHASVVVLPARRPASNRPSSRASSRITSRTNDRRARVTTSRRPLLGVHGQRLIFLAAFAGAIGLLAGGAYRHTQSHGASVSSLPPSAPAKIIPPATETTHSAASEAVLAAEVSVRGLAPSEPPATIAPIPSESSPSEPSPSDKGVVQVQIRTQPSGASVRAVGTDAHCSAAPCAIEVPRGRPITLRAETRNRSVERTLTFDDQTEVELRVSSFSRGKPVSRPAATSGKLPSDLKVPAIFRDR